MSIWNAPDEFPVVRALWIACFLAAGVAGMMFAVRAVANGHGWPPYDTIMKLVVVLTFGSQGALWLGTYILVAIETGKYLLGGDYLPAAGVGIIGAYLAVYFAVKTPRLRQH